jgi:hypothetical protein
MSEIDGLWFCVQSSGFRMWVVGFLQGALARGLVVLNPNLYPQP